MAKIKTALNFLTKVGPYNSNPELIYNQMLYRDYGIYIKTEN